MRDLLHLGARAGELLKARKEKIAVGETSAGGLISAALLAVPGASEYFAGGAVTYSPRAVRGLLDLTFDELRAKGIRSSSEAYAEILAETIRQKHGGVAWGLSETGAAGPADMGKVMGVLKPRLTGRADMTEVSKQVKAALSK